MTEAYLEETNLSGADLTNANMTKVYMEGTNLQGATLVGVNLTSAYMEGVNLNSTNLSGATLESVRGFDDLRLCRTIMPNGSVNKSDC